MALEIERKFLVKDSSFRKIAINSSTIRQAYISDKVNGTVRIRVRDDKAYLTIKGENHGSIRSEWEYEIPVSDAEEMAAELTGGWSIDKVRYIVMADGLRWEIDEFHGRNEGLVLAEVELPSPDAPYSTPPFIGKEVTGDARYYNSVLAKN